MSYFRLLLLFGVLILAWLAYKELSRKKIITQKEDELKQLVLEDEGLDLEEEIAKQKAKNLKKQEKIAHAGQISHIEEGDTHE